MIVADAARSLWMQLHGWILLDLRGAIASNKEFTRMFSAVIGAFIIGLGGDRSSATTSLAAGASR